MTIVFACPGNQTPGRQFYTVTYYLYADVASNQAFAAVYMRSSFLSGFSAASVGSFLLAFWYELLVPE